MILMGMTFTWLGMGDGFDAVRQRMEDSSLQEGINLKNPDKESGRGVVNVEGFSPEAKDVLERNSDEPGEPGKPGRIHDQEPLKTDLAGMEVPFPYSDTKLRPEAPPFTPECVSPSPEPSFGEPDADNSCFVNVELKVNAQDDEELFPGVEISGLVGKQPKDNEIKDGRLKPFSITSIPQIEKPVPDIEIPEAGDEEDQIVGVRTTTSATSGTVEAPAVERVRILSPAFFFGNKTQIIIIVASILVCVILLIFVLV